MTETQSAIAAWAQITFGPTVSNARTASRANEEMAELVAALTVDDRHPKAVEEAADIVIVLFRLVEQLGGDLLAAVDAKMAINRARRWVADGSGHGRHVKAP
jgi:NTP pyrophosphatase (non-canonical NTP hydrolase)